MENSLLLSRKFGIFAERKVERKIQTMEKNVAYWTDIAEYDLDTAQAMLDTGRYLYVGFMCHQVIEKMLKAYWSQVLEEPPLKIHNLSRLAEISGLDQEMSKEQKLFIDVLDPLNIEARYPSYKEKLASRFSKNICNELLNRTKELSRWIKNKL